MDMVQLKKMLPILFLTVLSLTVGGCAIGRKYRAPENLAQKETVFQSGREASYKRDEPVLDWWKELNDEKLSRVVELTLENNLDLQVALTQMEKARAVLSETGADRFPTVNSNMSYARERLSGEDIAGPSIQRTLSLYDAGFDAFWELDLFGRVSHRIKQARAESRQAEADFHGVQVTVAAEAARAYIELRGTQYRLDIAKRNAANQKKTLEITEQKSAGGQSTKLDVARAKAQLSTTLARIPQLEASIARVIRRLSVLTGQLPNALFDELQTMQPLPSVPQTVNIGDPQTLLMRRPDVQSAEASASAALANYNLALNELFPEVSFKGTLGFTATRIGQWFSAGALRASTGPSLSWRILDLKRILSRMKQTDQDSRASIQRYQKTVLEALEEVENAMTDFSKEDERRLNLQQAARSSIEASGLAHSRFEAGLDDFLELLVTERTQLEAEDALAVSEISTALNLIAIYKALGGGWQIKR